MSGTHAVANEKVFPIELRAARSVAPVPHAWQALSLEMNQFMHGTQPCRKVGVEANNTPPHDPGKFCIPFRSEFIADCEETEPLRDRATISDKAPVPTGHLREHEEADLLIT